MPKLVSIWQRLPRNASDSSLNCATAAIPMPLSKDLDEFVELSIVPRKPRANTKVTMAKNRVRKTAENFPSAVEYK